MEISINTDVLLHSTAFSSSRECTFRTVTAE